MAMDDVTMRDGSSRASGPSDSGGGGEKATVAAMMADNVMVGSNPATGAANAADLQSAAARAGYVSGNPVAGCDGCVPHSETEVCMRGAVPTDEVASREGVAFSAAASAQLPPNVGAPRGQRLQDDEQHHDEQHHDAQASTFETAYVHAVSRQSAARGPGNAGAGGGPSSSGEADHHASAAPAAAAGPQQRQPHGVGHGLNGLPPTDAPCALSASVGASHVEASCSQLGDIVSPLAATSGGAIADAVMEGEARASPADSRPAELAGLQGAQALVPVETVQDVEIAPAIRCGRALVPPVAAEPLVYPGIEGPRAASAQAGAEFGQEPGGGLAGAVATTLVPHHPAPLLGQLDAMEAARAEGRVPASLAVAHGEDGQDAAVLQQLPSPGSHEAQSGGGGSALPGGDTGAVAMKERDGEQPPSAYRYPEDPEDGLLTVAGASVDPTGRLRLADYAGICQRYAVVAREPPRARLPQPDSPGVRAGELPSPHLTWWDDLDGAACVPAMVRGAGWRLQRPGGAWISVAFARTWRMAYVIADLQVKVFAVDLGSLVPSVVAAVDASRNATVRRSLMAGNTGNEVQEDVARNVSAYLSRPLTALVGTEGACFLRSMVHMLDLPDPDMCSLTA